MLREVRIILLNDGFDAYASIDPRQGGGLHCMRHMRMSHGNAICVSLSILAVASHILINSMVYQVNLRPHILPRLYPAMVSSRA